MVQIRAFLVFFFHKFAHSALCTAFHSIAIFCSSRISNLHDFSNEKVPKIAVKFCVDVNEKGDKCAFYVCKEPLFFAQK